MATLTDILTTAKNVVTAINSVGQALVRGQGNITSETISGSAALVTTGQGYLVNVSVVVAGTTEGFVNNSATVAGVAATNTIAATTATAPEAVYPCGIPFSYGLVVTPGTGQSLCVTYFQSSSAPA